MGTIMPDLGRFVKRDLADTRGGGDPHEGRGTRRQARVKAGGIAGGRSPLVRNPVGDPGGTLAPSD